MFLIKAASQADEDAFDASFNDLKKNRELLGHHLKGSQDAKKRFEAMLG